MKLSAATLIGTTEASLPIADCGRGSVVELNHKLLTQAIKPFDAESSIALQIKDSTSPVLIQDGALSFVVMPMSMERK